MRSSISSRPNSPYRSRLFPTRVSLSNLPISQEHSQERHSPRRIDSLWIEHHGAKHGALHLVGAAGGQQVLVQRGLHACGARHAAPFLRWWLSRRRVEGWWLAKSRRCLDFRLAWRRGRGGCSGSGGGQGRRGRRGGGLLVLLLVLLGVLGRRRGRRRRRRCCSSLRRPPST